MLNVNAKVLQMMKSPNQEEITQSGLFFNQDKFTFPAASNRTKVTYTCLNYNTKLRCQTTVSINFPWKIEGENKDKMPFFPLSSSHLKKLIIYDSLN